jgi:hypothetical protein
MRLSRVGNAIHSYLAEDADGNGQPDRWILAGSDSSPSLPRALLVGPYLHSQAGTNLGTMTFDSVTIVENRRVPPVTDCSVGQTLLSKTYDAGDPGALSDAFVVLRSGALRPAVVAPGRLRITGEGGDLATAVWYDIPGSDQLPQGGFIAELDLFLSPPGDADAADGLTLAFIERGAEILGPPGAPDLCGAPGGSLGYGGGTILERTDGHPSFAVEIDNWIGGGAPGNEPSDGGIQAGVGRYHVGLDLNGEVSSVQTNLDAGVPSHLLPDLFRPEGVHLHVQYFPDGTVDAYVSSNRSPFTMYHVISHRVPRLQGPVLLGITGGTGGAWCTREIDNFRVRLTSCAPGSGSGLHPVPIDLGNITGGGDGDLYTPAPHVGVDPRNGRFADA